VRPTKKQKRPGKPERPAIPLPMAIRMFFLGSLAVAAAAWAIWRYYWVPRTPMLAPVEYPVEVESADPPPPTK